ncbi:MAG: ribonuclease III [Candidatus Lambdaproteobacteria bacterium]|nr:ribonuclease III [Candidatus Lambdaproteobacteria bacterium]
MDSLPSSALFERLGYRFGDEALYGLALTHKSYSNENPTRAARHNERLEFLGDAVLSFVVSDLLMRQYPELPEGRLSKMRAALVSESALAELALELRLGEALRIGKGEESSGGRQKKSLLSDTLEALIAAVYLDSREREGVAAVYRVVESLFRGRIAEAGHPEGSLDFKTELQELVQKHYKDRVSYRIVEEKGPDHDKRFQAAVVFRNRDSGTGVGRSKKEAEQAAAADALGRLQMELREARS